MTSVEHEVRAAIAQKLGLNEDEIGVDASIIEDLGADSLDAVEMLIAMEGKFGLTISDEQAARIHTIRQAVDYINHEIESRA